jgi:TolB-like protein
MEGTKANGTTDPSFAPVDAGQVRACLDALLSSPEFSASGRKAQLLRYLVEQTLAGQGSKITEYGIGLDVFERPASFDPRTDSLVRAEISRLRIKLKRYYDDGSRTDPIVIDLPQRGYVPRFTFRKAEAADPVRSEEPAPPQSRPPLWAIALLVPLVVLAGVTYWYARTPSPGPLKSLVVLPFENYSKDPQNEYLADGLTEELTNQLAQWRELRVVARTSAFTFKGKPVDVRQIGRQLNVDAVLEGSCVKQADRIKITAQLSRAADGYHLWSRSFEARSNDMLSVQDEMAQAIATAVHGVGRDRPAPAAALSTTNADAHDLFLRASHEFSRHTPESVKSGLDLLHQAVKLDPGYVRAYIMIERAEVALNRYTAQSPREGMERAKAALETALELDPRSSDAHGDMAFIAYNYDWDWPRSEREFKLALDQGADATIHSFYGSILATRGRFEEARREFGIAQDLDPLGMPPRVNQAIALELERRYTDEIRVLRGALDINPNQFDIHYALGLVSATVGDCKAGYSETRLAAEHFQAPVTRLGLALVDALCGGDKGPLVRFLAEAEKGMAGFVSPYQLASAYAYLNKKDQAIGYLEKSADAKEGQITFIKYAQAFDGIRSDPRFVALEKRVGLEP